MEGESQHFVLVHGACHGAWCWYKLTPMLISAGHRVTALDLATCGIHPKQLSEVSTFSGCSQPLMEFMESLLSKKKVILVGHSFGGISLAMAMDQYPEKISAAVFLTAFMPDSSNHPSYVIEKYFERTPLEAFLDTEFGFELGRHKLPTSMLFGFKFLSSMLYQNSSQEDFTLATTLVRVASLYMEDLSNSPTLSKDRYGSVDQVYIVCDEDKAIPEEFQRWMVENNPVKEVKEIKGSDHMTMLSMPQELCNCLLQIAKTCS
ncbi:salicylic acid-binding protein 2-like [Tasmannia lanceolata]|uniref:salicylic acid-binding protein 2-like n=1 Tax=Tasmannia lanceolata TaxID=3420 RepID=UPI0040641068